MKQFLQKILRLLAYKIIHTYHPKIIGVTGSVGKTTTKEAVFTVLSTKFRCRKSLKNYNNEIGVPLTFIGKESPEKSFWGWLVIVLYSLRIIFFRERKYPEIIIVELGADHVGDLSYLLDFIPCDIGILTNISQAHMEFFRSLENIIAEKSQIVTSLHKTKTAVMNIDDPVIAKVRSQVKAKVLTYGFSDEAQIKASDVMVSGQTFGESTDVHEIRGVSFKLSYQGSTLPVSLPKVLGRQHINAALAAAGIGIVLEMNLVEISESLKSYTPPPGRMNLISGIKHTLVIDDTYNSSPAAARMALEVAAEISLEEEKKKFIVLGDMLELGTITEEAHRELGRVVAKLKFDELITVGERALYIAEGAKEKGMDEDHVFSFTNREEAGRFLQDRIEEGDLILVKGSQGMRMETIVKEIMADPMRAKLLLVRQDDTWLERGA
jgi:UDP-N-acetylmuramoyl-tripeptide--D-alanyl-D-alanine ligase